MQDRLTLASQQAALTLNGKMLPLMEQFYTIQGEGFHSGKAACFIRVGGCDIGCHWCDVKESWNAAIYPLTSIDEIIREAMKHPARAVVVTGGEPSLYPMEELTSGLRQNGFKTFIETSGAYPLSGSWDWICLSPKKNMPPLAQNYDKANELKVIVYNRHDFEWAREQAKNVKSDCLLYLQPEWSRSGKIMPELVNFVMENPAWQVSLQTHKYMHIP